MDQPNNFSIKTFTETTKTVCACSSISIFLIVLFIISPLSKLLMVSSLMKILILVLLIYTIYLNIKQTNYLSNANKLKLSNQISSQLTINVICSYIFTFFIGLLIIFVLKSFF